MQHCFGSLQNRITKAIIRLFTFMLTIVLCFSMSLFVPATSAHAAQIQDEASASSGKSVEVANEWDVSVAQDKSVMASVRALDDGVSYELSIQGYGRMKNFDEASGAPWQDSYAQKITMANIGEGVTNIGSFALALPALKTVHVASTVAAIGNNALGNASSLVAFDASACTLFSVEADAFAVSSASSAAKRTLYVRDTNGARLLGDALSAEAAACTAISVTNGGTFAQDTSFAAGSYAIPSLERNSFVTWASDLELMHPIQPTDWRSYTKGIVYARFVEKSQGSGNPQPYPGGQGFDQTVQLLDLSKLPSRVVKNDDVRFYGQRSDNSYDNRLQTAFNGYDDQVFAFSLSRGFNANGGDGAYQVSFTMPYISVLDEDGNTVASYDDGNGKLKLFSIVFDGVDGAASGFTIYAFRIGLEAGTLDAGTYTLRFGSGLGANNGNSFLGANVDFRFVVEYPQQYQLEFDTSSDDAVVSGIRLAEGVSTNVDVEIPTQYDDKTVAGIADGAFAGQNAVRSISVPPSVRSIGSRAFANMTSLSTVSMAGRADNAPTWGNEVFTGSANLVLEGYSTAATVKNAAASYDNVVFQPLEDGVYVNHKAVTDGLPVILSARQPQVSVQVVKSGKVSTADYRGFISNTNIVTHKTTSGLAWSELTARANGDCNLVIRDASGKNVATLALSCTGFANNGSSDSVKLEHFQGNGCTIMLSSVSADGKSTAVYTNAHDETLSYCDNSIPEGVSFKGGVITLEIAGPGAAWDASRWNWDDWTTNHLNPYVSLCDAQGNTVATVGGGLTWITLTNSVKMQLAIDDGVMTPGSTYTLVAKDQMTGHNISAKLLREIRWSFKATKQDIATCSSSGIADQTYTGSALEPAFTMTRAIPAIQLWDEASEKQYTKREASTATLNKGSDYDVTYENNVNPGTATAIITGKGDYVGEIRKSFKIIDPNAPSNPDRPDNPDIPDNPKPDNPGTDQPGTPDNPGNPTPGQPDAPSNPTPGQPSTDDPVATEPEPVTTQAMYRLYNPNSGEHFYTASPVERQAVIDAGWNDEGIGWTAPTEGIQVYRLYNSFAGEHHYTTSAEERDMLVGVGWTWEEGGWCSDAGQAVPLYRAYNPNAFANNHHYTTDWGEFATLLSIGWRDEGIGWYGAR